MLISSSRTLASSLGYDARRPRVLFRFTKTKAGHSLMLRVHDGGKVANAKTFFTQHKLDVGRHSRRYTPTVVRNGVAPTFSISLKQAS